MPEVVHVNTTVPSELKCRLFSQLALRNQRFSGWLRERAEEWLQQVESRQGNITAHQQGHTDGE